MIFNSSNFDRVSVIAKLETGEDDLEYIWKRSAWVDIVMIITSAWVDIVMIITLLLTPGRV